MFSHHPNSSPGDFPASACMPLQWRVLTTSWAAMLLVESADLTEQASRAPCSSP